MNPKLKDYLLNSLPHLSLDIIGEIGAYAKGIRLLPAKKTIVYSINDFEFSGDSLWIFGGSGRLYIETKDGITERQRHNETKDGITERQRHNETMLSRGSNGKIWLQDDVEHWKAPETKEITGIREYKSELFVVQKCICNVFDLQGNHKRRFEFADEVLDFQIYNDEMYMLNTDNWLRVLNVYAGSVFRKMQINSWTKYNAKFLILSNGEMIFCSKFFLINHVTNSGMTIQAAPLGGQSNYPPVIREHDGVIYINSSFGELTAFIV